MKKYLIVFFVLIAFAGNVSMYSQSFIDEIKSCKKQLMLRGLGNLDSMDNCYIGKKIPNLKLITIQGENLEIEKLKGKVIVLNLWSTSCGPCIAEIPGLNDLVSIYDKKDIAFISLLHESKQSYEKFIKKGKSFNFKVVAKAKKIYQKQLDFIGFPRNIVIDKNGVIKKVFSGGENSNKAPELIKQKLIPVIDELLY